MQALAENETSNQCVNGTGGHGRFVEPTPNWSHAIELWGLAWPIHLYGFGAANIILTLLAAIQLILACVRKSIRSRGYYSTLNALILLSGVSRIGTLFYDPYNSLCRLPRALGYISLHISSPCLTSTFLLLFVVLMKLTQPKIAARRIFSPIVLISVVAFNFVLGVGADLIAAYLHSASVVLLICFVYLLVLGGATSIAYMYIFIRIYNRAVRNRKLIKSISSSDDVEMSKRKGIASSTENIVTAKPRPSVCNLRTDVPIAARISMVAAIVYFIICVVNVYYLVSMLLSRHTVELSLEGTTRHFTSPWYWFAYQTSMRIGELVLFGIISFVTGLSLFRRKKTPSS